METKYITGFFAEVMVPRPVRSLFTYSVPASVQSKIGPGKRVLVPFGKRNLIGLVARMTDKTRVTGIKPILDVLDETPVAGANLLNLAMWTAAHYYAPPGDILPLITPRGDMTVDTFVEIAEGSTPPESDGKASEIYAILKARGGGRKVHLLAKDAGVTVTGLKKILGGSHARQWVKFTQGARTYGKRARQTHVEQDKDSGLVELTPQQKHAVEEVWKDVSAGRFFVSLIHGVTGSGKTEVYAHLARRTLAMGGSVLVLAPEIALADMLAERLERRLGVKPVIIHSDMAPGERDARLESLSRMEAALVVGARSAVFAPVRNLRLIIVDEEHDPSYKQENSPRYNGRDVAIKRASLEGAAVALGSATPSLESYYHAVNGKYGLLELSQRIDGRPMPKVEIVEPAPGAAMGERLLTEIGERLAKGEQSLLFINRRGFSRYVQCQQCGHVYECKNCSVSLVHHGKAGKLACHTCGYEEPAPDTCEKCGSPSFYLGGPGSERVEKDLAALFPTARIARMDRDTTTKRRAGAGILKAVEAGEVDILIGTQMVTKGHDYPSITLVGAVSAEDTLRLPDFRAAERTFQLITQAAGRAGRGEKPGLVLVQAHGKPGHALLCAAEHDYAAFLNAETPLRQIVGYPPFARIAFIKIDASGERRGLEYLAKMAQVLERIGGKIGGITVWGPAESVIFKTRNRFNWRIMLKAPNHAILYAALEMYFEGEKKLFGGTGAAGVSVTVDMDPVSAM
ncbi:MAG: primosomal protein N' [Nitrospinae bacterium]|nr:primosomal protein N' [Nitrospinota bacterium]